MNLLEKARQLLRPTPPARVNRVNQAQLDPTLSALSFSLLQQLRRRYPVEKANTLKILYSTANNEVLNRHPKILEDLVGLAEKLVPSGQCQVHAGGSNFGIAGSEANWPKVMKDSERHLSEREFHPDLTLVITTGENELPQLPRYTYVVIVNSIVPAQPADIRAASIRINPEQFELGDIVRRMSEEVS